MISGFDHLVIAVRDIQAGLDAYETLLGAKASPPATHEGATTAIIQCANIAVELMAPDGASEGAERLRAALETGEGLKSLVFATTDIERAHQRSTRVGLEPEPIRDAQGAPGARVFRLGKERAHGLRLFVMQRAFADHTTDAGAAGVTGVDHIVIRTPAPETMEALVGARLGLDLRLVTKVQDRTLMLFRCGDAVLEVVEHPAAATADLWGLTWRVADADAAQARLSAEGLNVSEVRMGLKPRSRVFTVRDRTCGVPTLMIEPPPRSDRKS